MACFADSGLHDFARRESISQERKYPPSLEPIQSPCGDQVEDRHDHTPVAEDQNDGCEQALRMMPEGIEEAERDRHERLRGDATPGNQR